MLQKLKLNFEEIPPNWRENLNFVQLRPTGRKGWKIVTPFEDNQLFYSFARKIFNNCPFDIRNNFTVNEFKSLVKKM